MTEAWRTKPGGFHESGPRMARPTLSVIIPVRSGELALPALVARLERDAAIREVLVCKEGSRPKSLNAGAARASGDLLWFLHADSGLEGDSVERLLEAAKRHPDAVLFFDLVFARDGGALIRLNQWGANLRSRLLKLPFGDQGLACRRETFKRIGPYPEGAPYGEDHLFVWQAHCAGVPLVPVGAPLVTSARRYAETGWLKLTLLYQYRWLAQAAGAAWRCLKTWRARR